MSMYICMSDLAFINIFKLQKKTILKGFWIVCVCVCVSICLSLCVCVLVHRLV